MMKILLPELHEKGWGHEVWIVNNGLYCGKILHFKKDKRCSFHYHKLKNEHFYVLSGLFTLLTSQEDDITLAEENFLMEGDIVEIPVGLRHQMIARLDGELMEISTEHFESDSYRIVKGD